MRETFLYVLSNMPLLKTDAIVVLCGEDGESRLLTALQLFRQGGAPRLLLSGGRHEPPAILGAQHLLGVAMAGGIAPGALLTETGSQHTKEQAEAVVAIAKDKHWKSIALVASNYHLPRAFLTFAKVAGDLLLLPVAANAPWREPPPGADRTRFDLFHSESAKIAAYTHDCATPEEGLAHLWRWEQPTP